MEMEEMDLLEYWRILMKRKWLIVVLCAVTVIIAGVASMMMDPVYEASTTVMVHESRGALAQMSMLESLGGSSRNKVMNYAQIMRSRQILLPVMQVVGIEEREYGSISTSISIQPIQGTEILRISMQSTDPERAQLFVNTLASEFLNWNRNTQREDQRSAREFVEIQLQSVSADLRVAEERLRVYREDSRVLSPTNEIVAALEQISHFERSLAEATIEKVELENRMLRIDRELGEQTETLVSSTTISENPFVARYRDRLADLEIQLSGAKERYTDLHPTVLALQAEIADVRGKLTEQVERVISTETRTANPIHRELYGQLIALQVELTGIHAREEALGHLQEEAEEVFQSLPTRELELARLMRDAKVLEEIYIMLMQRNEEFRISEAMQVPDVQVIDAAILPENPVKPRVKLNIAIAGVLGLFIGTGLAFLLEYVDTTIKTKEQAETLLGLPVLGQIPYFDNNGDPIKEKATIFNGNSLGR